MSSNGSGRGLAAAADGWRSICVFRRRVSAHEIKRAKAPALTKYTEWSSGPKTEPTEIS
jgi:hypothetical protein